MNKKKVRLQLINLLLWLSVGTLYINFSILSNLGTMFILGFATCSIFYSLIDLVMEVIFNNG